MKKLMSMVKNFQCYSFRASLRNSQKPWFLKNAVADILKMKGLDRPNIWIFAIDAVDWNRALSEWHQSTLKSIMVSYYLWTPNTHLLTFNLMVWSPNDVISVVIDKMYEYMHNFLICVNLRSILYIFWLAYLYELQIQLNVSIMSADVVVVSCCVYNNSVLQFLLFTFSKYWCWF